MEILLDVCAALVQSFMANSYDSTKVSCDKKKSVTHPLGLTVKGYYSNQTMSTIRRLNWIIYMWECCDCHKSYKHLLFQSGKQHNYEFQSSHVPSMATYCGNSYPVKCWNHTDVSVSKNGRYNIVRSILILAVGFSASLLCDTATFT